MVRTTYQEERAKAIDEAGIALAGGDPVRMSTMAPRM